MMMMRMTIMMMMMSHLVFLQDLVASVFQPEALLVSFLTIQIPSMLTLSIMKMTIVMIWSKSGLT